MINRDADGNAVLTCDVGDRSDLTVSWYKEDKIIQNEQKIKLLLTSAQVQENKPYSCSVSNPVSSEQSNNVTVSCKLFLFQMFLICRQTCCFCAPPLSHTPSCRELCEGWRIRDRAMMIIRGRQPK